MSRGATMIEYWHWHTLPFGAETYWGGVLPHSQQPGRTYQQVAALGDEFRRAGASAAGLTPDADISIVYSNETKWSLEEIPTLSSSSGAPDQRSYQAIIDAFYRGAFDAGLQVRFDPPLAAVRPGHRPSGRRRAASGAGRGRLADCRRR